MNKFKNVLKKILPMPVNSFMREINKLYQIENQLLKKLDMQENLLQMQAENQMENYQYLLSQIMQLSNNIHSMESRLYDTEKLTIPIAMATDNCYITPTLVAITSILENAYKNVFYDFYILKSGDFSDEYEEKLTILSKFYAGGGKK